MTPLRLALIAAVFSLGFLVGWVTSDARRGVAARHDDPAEAKDAKGSKETNETKETPGASANGQSTTEDGADEARIEAVSRVGVVAIRRESMHRVVIGYGTVAPAPRSLRTVTLPFECRVVRISTAVGVAVAGGSDLAAGTELAEVAISQDAQSARAEALSTQAEARVELAQAQRRVELHLATAQDLQQAKAALALADIKAKAWAQRIDGDTLVIRAVSAGTVVKIAAQPGQVVPAGTEIIEISEGDDDEARLGFEPSDMARLSVGATIKVIDVRRPEVTFETVIRYIPAVLDPDTRLADAVVALPKARIPFGGLVRGELQVTVPESWVVPRQALVSTDDGVRVFTVVDGKAVAHAATVLANTEADAAIEAEGLGAADQVVVLGNYQLADGMPVQISGAP